MTNHYHLVIETPDANLSKGMRQLNGVFTQAMNRRHGRTGHLFQGRFKAILVQKESHFLEVCRYVVLNPVRAKAVKQPAQWKWSSYAATAGLRPAHGCLSTAEIIKHFGARRSSAQQRYREFVGDGAESASLWDEVRGQSLLGVEGFVEGLLPYLTEKMTVREIPKGQRYVGRPALEKLFKSAADEASRDKLIAEAIERHGYSQAEIAGFLGLHYSTISRLMKSAAKEQG
jgi:hypothetical protein